MIRVNYTTTPPPMAPPVAKPLLSNPAEFVRTLYASWKRCRELQQQHKLSPAAIGAAFYKVLAELFDRSGHAAAAEEAARKKTDPLIPTAELRKALDERIGKAMDDPRERR